MKKRLHITVRCEDGFKPKDSIDAAMRAGTAIGETPMLAGKLAGAVWDFFPNAEKPVYSGIFFRESAGAKKEGLAGKHVTWMFGKGCSLPPGVQVGDEAAVSTIGWYNGEDFEVLIVKVKVGQEWVEFQP